MKVCLASYSLRYPQGGAYLWVFLNWALGLKDLGLHVVWLDSVRAGTHEDVVSLRVEMLRRRLAEFGLAESLCVIEHTGRFLANHSSYTFVDACSSDLLINLGYDLFPAVVECFRRTAFVDIDPGLTQIWLSSRQLSLPEHTKYFTYGENISFNPLIPSCNICWNYTRPPVHLPSWLDQSVHEPSERYTTVSNWWGSSDYLSISGKVVDNSKRSAFLEYLDLPENTPSLFELAIPLTEDEDVTSDIPLLRSHGWSVRHVDEVSFTPSGFRAYVHSSKGEFSCLKRAYSLLHTAWTSERTLNYLASGKPCLVQHTGPSAFLPDDRGLFRFRSFEEAIHYLALIESDYSAQRRAARTLAETFFDSARIIPEFLSVALS